MVNSEPANPPQPPEESFNREDESATESSTTPTTTTTSTTRDALRNTLDRLSATVSNAWSPSTWNHLSDLIFGPERTSSRSSSRRRSSRRSRRSSRQSSSRVFPPHSYAHRRSGGEAAALTGSLDSSEAGSTNSVTTTSYPYPPFFFTSGIYDRSFGYSILDGRTRDHCLRLHSSSSSCHRRRRRFSDEKEKNFLSALLSILVIATLATALTQPKWFSVRGGACGRRFIGLQLFFELNTQGNTHSDTVHGVNNLISRKDVNSEESESDDSSEAESLPNAQPFLGPFDAPVFSAIQMEKILNVTSTKVNSTHINENMEKEEQRQNATQETKWKDSRERSYQAKKFDHIHPLLPKKWTTRDCTYSEILPLQRSIILLCLLAIMCNLLQFFLDTLGTNNKWLNIIRIHAIGSILGVIFTIIMIGISYMIATIIEVNERAMTPSSSLMSSQPSSSIPLALPSLSKDSQSYPSGLEIRFELSYYLVTLSGLIGLMAAACNLLRKPTVYFLAASGSGRNLLIDGSCSHPFFMDDEPLSPIWTGAAAPGSAAAAAAVMSAGLPPPPPPYSP